MSNLKRHFNFGHNKPPLSSHSRPMAPDATSFSKASFMNEIGNCLELCSAYIQTLNSLCSAGILLAQSLRNIVKDVPFYSTLAGQFYGAWEEVSQDTAGYSAAVKTETLMMLQEVLNCLEAEANGTSEPVIFMDSIQAVGHCLVYYMELQSLFSSSSRIFSKLVKNDNLDSHDKFGALKNSLKKHFGQVANKFNAPKHLPYHPNYSNKPPSEELSVIAPPASWKSRDISIDSLNNLTSSTYNLPITNSPVRQTKSLNVSCELEDVINLLSCKPGGGELAAPPTQQQQVPQLQQQPMWPPQCPLDGKRTWPRVSNNSSSFAFEHMLWSVDNLDFQDSRLSENKFPPMWPAKETSLSKWVGDADSSSSDNTCPNNDTDVFSMGIDLTGHDLVASVRQRRHSSSDGNSECNLNSEQLPSQVVPWEVRSAKTCTWPLKQAAPPFDYNSLGKLSEAKYSLFGYPNI